MQMMIGARFQLSYDAKNKYSKKEGLRLLFLYYTTNTKHGATRYKKLNTLYLPHV